MPKLIGALAAQIDLRGRPLDPGCYEVLLLLNNCTDETAAVARSLARAFPTLALHAVEISLPAEEAHVGRARQVLFDVAYARLCRLGKAHGLILTTDADTLPAPDWIAQTEAEIALGVVGVGGRVQLLPEERASLPPGVRRLFLLDIGYRRALEEMRHLYAPDPGDPFPRHHQHFGGSLAVQASAYEAAGGMPLVRTSEDVALYRAVLRSGGRFRHSERVRCFTSARMLGRASGGLADAIAWWHEQVEGGAEVLVEGAIHAERRLAGLGWSRLTWPRPATHAWRDSPPEPPPPGQAAEIQVTLAALRERNAYLRTLSLSERLTEALQRFELEIDPGSDLL